MFIRDRDRDRDPDPDRDRDHGPGPVRTGSNSGLILLISFRESDIQYVESNNLFHTPGVFYRPESLKTMNVLLGNTESRIVYKNFNLENLNSNDLDPTHYMYQKYLQYNRFIPPHEKNYFSHTALNTRPETPSTTENKGLFNVFPLDLMSVSDEFKKPNTNLGNRRTKYFFFVRRGYLKNFFFQELSPLHR
jgi:hypothetical protein